MPIVKKTVSAQKARALEVVQRLEAEYPDATCSLDYTNPVQLMVSTILAAQCTDERVNIVTKSLFKQYKNAKEFANAPAGELEEAVRTCGFYRQKAKSIREACRDLVEKHGGKVPGSMEELIKLRGVGRKTANVLMAECFEPVGVIVDTHCKRLSNRLGFTTKSDPDKIEQDIMKLLPREHWRMYSHCMVFHGRAVCNARIPRCSQCAVRDLCPFPDTREGKKIAR
ncbi:MAG: endonuclease III [Candidatus Hydrogenedentes bacterium]|nr:endonuclease III [Candidatus Hydrogenedentota bacterium]